MEKQAVKSQDYLPAVHQWADYQWTDYSEVHYQPTVQYQAGN